MLVNRIFNKDEFTNNLNFVILQEGFSSSLPNSLGFVRIWSILSLKQMLTHFEMAFRD
jgi:hypothetical protein